MVITEEQREIDRQRSEWDRFIQRIKRQRREVERGLQESYKAAMSLVVLAKARCRVAEHIRTTIKESPPPDKRHIVFSKEYVQDLVNVDWSQLIDVYGYGPDSDSLLGLVQGSKPLTERVEVANEISSLLFTAIRLTLVLFGTHYTKPLWLIPYSTNEPVSSVLGLPRTPQWASEFLERNGFEFRD